MTTIHKVALNNLSPATVYHYRVRERDEANNLYIGPDHTFSTSPLPEGVILPGTNPVSKEGIVLTPWGGTSRQWEHS